mmetsp:Transcript_52306/g.167722  ORF Transcript_52306/g.167722 Transcript_52306/m.167722 type:complete len:208 (+) Transcript_52306:566-1189(+)
MTGIVSTIFMKRKATSFGMSAGTRSRAWWNFSTTSAGLHSTMGSDGSGGGVCSMGRRPLKCGSITCGTCLRMLRLLAGAAWPSAVPFDSISAFPQACLKLTMAGSSGASWQVKKIFGHLLGYRGPSGKCGLYSCHVPAARQSTTWSWAVRLRPSGAHITGSHISRKACTPGAATVVPKTRPARQSSDMIPQQQCRALHEQKQPMSHG